MLCQAVPRATVIQDLERSAGSRDLFYISVVGGEQKVQTSSRFDFDRYIDKIYRALNLFLSQSFVSMHSKLSNEWLTTFPNRVLCFWQLIHLRNSLLAFHWGFNTSDLHDIGYRKIGRVRSSYERNDLLSYEANLVSRTVLLMFSELVWIPISDLE